MFAYWLLLVGHGVLLFFVISLKLVFLTELGVVDGAFVVVRNVVWLPPTCTDRVVLHTCVAVARVAVIDATQRMKEESPFVASSHFSLLWR